MKSKRIIGGVMAVAMGVLVGCASTPSATTQLRTNEAVAPTATVQDSELGWSEDTLTPAEEGVGQEATGYSVQVYRNTIFAGNRCQWFWVPSRWGWPYANNWNSGRWVLVCSRREIPWWWYAGPYGTYGRSNDRPRFRPNFPDRFRQLDRDHDRRGGRDRDRDFGRDNDRDRGGDRDRDNRGPIGGGGGGGMGGGMGGRR